MKRSNTKESKRIQKVIVMSFKTIMIFLIVLQSFNSFGQKYKRREKCYLGAGIDNVSSGNSHGAFISSYLIIKKGRKSFNLGTLFQTKAMELNGGKLSFSYNLTGGKKYDLDEEELAFEEAQGGKQKRQILQLNVFGFSQYVHNSLLSGNSSWTEQRASSLPETQWNKLRLSTAEAGIGFELYVKLTKRVSWKNYAAGSVYYHVNYVKGMYNEKYGPSLVLGTGIVICPL